MLNVGDVAPDFSVTAHNGETIKLANYRGKRVLLWFYPKADTPGCTAEGCSFRDHRAAYADKGVTIFGVSLDNVADNAAFAKKFDYNFPLLCDTDKKIALAYGAIDSAADTHAKRISYLIDANGKIEKAFPKVDAKTHPAELLATL